MLALSDAVDNGVYLTKLLSQRLFNDTYCIPMEVVTNCKSLYDALHSKENVLGKCLRIDIVLLKEFIDNKSVTKIHYFNKNGSNIKGTLFIYLFFVYC